MRCARCDHEFPGDDRFCGRCGLARSVDGQSIDPLVGLTLAGRYLIERRIGVGGMGTVYLGTYNAIGQRVAIKVLHERYARDAQLVQRFQNEARTYGRLQHPNLVTLHDYGNTPDGTLYMVMEYCPGTVLSGLLRDRGSLPAGLAVEILTQIAQGLAFAHRAGVVHRDLKPENVILIESRPGRYHAKLLDFGIAKCLNDDLQGLTQAGMVFGTPEYMAPEQARGERVDARTDVYALGTILFELLVGKPPFTGTNKVNIMHRQASEVPPPPSTLVADGVIPAALESAIMRCLEKRAEDRYGSAAELIDALEGALNLPRPDAPSLPGEPPPGVASPTVHAGERVPEMSAGWTPQPDSGRSATSWPLLGAVAAAFLAAVASAAWFWSAKPPTGEDVEVPLAVAEAPPIASPAPGTIMPRPMPAARVIPSAPASQPASRSVPPVRALESLARAEPAEPATSSDPKRRLKLIADARRALRNGDFDDADRQLTQALKRQPDDADALSIRLEIKQLRGAVGRGRAHYTKGECQQALAELERVLEAAPGADGVSHMVVTCRDSLPPRTLSAD